MISTDTKSNGNGKVIELVDETARDMARAAIVQSAVTKNDLFAVEARLVDRLRRMEAMMILQLVILVMVAGGGLAMLAIR